MAPISSRRRILLPVLVGVILTLSVVPLNTQASPAAKAHFNFRSVLKHATARVNKTFPGSQFYEATSALPSGQTGTAPRSFHSWRFVFNVPATGTCKINGTVMIYYQQSAFSTPVYKCAPWLEDRVITVPLKMSLKTAIALKAKKGFKQPFDIVTVRWILGPTLGEPQYIFHVPALSAYVFVGMMTGKVTSGH